jgi:hypothetical protein
MIRLVLIVAIVGFAIVTFMPNQLQGLKDSGSNRVEAIRDVVGGRVPRFQKRLEGGASCQELMGIRDTYDPASADVADMNAKLSAIGCTSITSARID